MINNNIIIMTSNLGFEDIKLGFTKDNKNNITSSLKQKFSPSLINRIDNIIIFNKLTEENITTIINNKLIDLKLKYPTLNYSDNLINEIIKTSEYNEYGARKIDKIIDSKLESIIIDKILNNLPLIIENLNEYQPI